MNKYLQNINIKVQLDFVFSANGEMLTHSMSNVDGEHGEHYTC